MGSDAFGRTDDELAWRRYSTTGPWSSSPAHGAPDQHDLTPLRAWHVAKLREHAGILFAGTERSRGSRFAPAQIPGMPLVPATAAGPASSTGWLGRLPRQRAGPLRVMMNNFGGIALALLATIGGSAVAQETRRPIQYREFTGDGGA